MTITELRPRPTDPHTAQAISLRERAASLRSQAAQLAPLLATAYRRRASELELEAFLTGMLARNGDAPAA